ncbi:hypothetical protein [Streptomyces sp. NBC_00690]|uniref:hypothetical protein n=1 Tax=Streptomyces sp. NBC_00690 TaxID=2975808 RepID=UPI002E29B9B2|nr:hypothetical protein [Streptomyces sp. NBC_00690]
MQARKKWIASALAASAVVATVQSTGAASVVAQARAAAPSVPIVVKSGWSGRGDYISATCPQGTTLVGGGHDSQPVVSSLGHVLDEQTADAPSPDEPNSWFIRRLAGRSQAYAMCSPASSTPPIVVASDWSDPGEYISATCPEGTQLVGGGFDSRPYLNGFGNSLDDLDANAPSGDEPNSWFTKQHRGTSRAFAMCAQ